MSQEMLNNKSDEISAELLRALPIACVLFNEKLQLVECNQATVELIAKKPGERFSYFDEEEGVLYECAIDCADCDKMNKDECQAKQCLFKNWLYTVNTGESTPEEAEAARRRMAQISRESGKYTFNLSRRTLYGKQLFCETTAVPLTIKNSQYYALMIRDISDSLLREAAEEESRAKSRFLARMSHEIRTPMNAVLGITEIQLQKGSHPPDTEDAFLRIHRSSRMLLAIINDILDFSKAEAGKIEMVPVVYETSSLIIDSVQINLMHIGSKNIELDLYVSEKLPMYFVGDKLRIKQILNNLLSNAFKYTHEGVVRLSFDKETIEGQEACMLVIKVEDTGQGMTEEELNTLKSVEFSRFNARQNIGVEGSGLGMSIVYHLLGLMGGELLATSKPGVGTTFVARIPQKLESGKMIGAELAANLRNIESVMNSLKRVTIEERVPMPYGSVLVVDDVESNLFVAKGMLMPYKLKVETVMSGQQAIDLVQKGNEYDVIFMDHMMPGRDGIEVTKELRGMGYEAPIVALTANIVMDQAKIFMENGFSDFISKPIDAAHLDLCLNKYIRDKQPQEVLDAVKQMGVTVENQKVNVSTQLINSFLRDSKREIEVLKNILNSNDWHEKNFKLFTISTHGIKSALANIHMAELSSEAYELEQAGRSKNLDAIKALSWGFIGKLQAAIKLHSNSDETPDELAVDESKLYVHFEAIAKACDNYDKSLARKELRVISEYGISKKMRELVGEISTYLLHSDFEAAAEKARTVINI